MPIRRPILLAALAGAALAATPAFADEPDAPQGDGDYGADYVPHHGPAEAGDYPSPSPMPAYGYGGYGPMPGKMMGLPQQPAAPHFAYSDEERANWLKECRRRYGDEDNGLGGAVIGGVIGGVAGNRIAGKGNRAIGTIAGAAVGAVAGAAIDKAEDSGKARDICEDYLTRYEAGAGQGYGYYGAGYGQQVMWMPVVVGWNCKPKKPRVVEEWIEEKPARRVIPKKIVPVKGKIVPSKITTTQSKPIKTTK